MRSRREEKRRTTAAQASPTTALIPSAVLTSYLSLETTKSVSRRRKLVVPSSVQSCGSGGSLLQGAGAAEKMAEGSMVFFVFHWRRGTERRSFPSLSFSQPFTLTDA